DLFILTVKNGIQVQGQADFRPLQLRQHIRHATQIEPTASAPCQTTKSATGLASNCGSTATKAACPLERLRTGDEKMNAVLEKVKKVIGRDIPILTLGET